MHEFMTGLVVTRLHECICIPVSLQPHWLLIKLLASQTKTLICSVFLTSNIMTYPRPVLKSPPNVLVATRRGVFLSIAFSCVMVLWFMSCIEPNRLVQHVLRDSFAARDVQSINQPFSGSVNLSLSRWVDAPTINSYSLTAILPLTVQSLPALDHILESFFDHPPELHEVIVTCPGSILASTRGIVRKVVSLTSTKGRRHPEISLHSWMDGMDQATGVLHMAALHASTEWVLLLDERGLQSMDSQNKALLLTPHAVPFPVGPRGVVSAPENISCLLPSKTPQAASYLIPPLVIPSVLIQEETLHSYVSGVWVALGKRMLESSQGMLGGVVIGFEDTEDWCPIALATHRSSLLGLDTKNGSHNPGNVSKRYSGRFVIIFPSVDDLRLFSFVACSLQSAGHLVQVVIYTTGRDYNDMGSPTARTLVAPDCRLRYDKSIVPEWMNDFYDRPDAVVSIAEKDEFNTHLSTILEQSGRGSPIIRIPRTDLPYCQWMISLSLEEWRSGSVFP
jgi:hypothetical protein